MSFQRVLHHPPTRSLRIATLLLGAAGLPDFCFADDHPITLSGRLNLSIDSVSAMGATRPERNIRRFTRVSDSGSAIRMRGRESLGNGYSVHFQIETLVKSDSPGGYRTPRGPNSNVWASRNSGIGIDGPFGSLLLGYWDVYYTNHIPIIERTFLSTGFASTALALLGGDKGFGGFTRGVMATDAASIARETRGTAQGLGAVDTGRREGNLLRYRSPDWYNLSLMASYVMPEGARNYEVPVVDAAGSESGHSGQWRSTLDSGHELMLQYNDGIRFANYSYYRRNDFGMRKTFAGNNSINHKLALGIQYRRWQLGTVFEHNRHQAPAGSFYYQRGEDGRETPSPAVDRERSVVVLFAAYNPGPWIVGASYARAGDVRDHDGQCQVDGVAGCANTGATYWQLTGILPLSKMTNLYATFARINNRSAAAYDFLLSSAISDTRAQIGSGSNPQALQLGMSMAF